MERDVIVGSFGGNSSKAKIIIDKNGMRVENKTPTYEQDDFFIRDFIADCINMDEWKYSWHIDVSKARFKKSKERKEIRKILQDKIEDRKQEIQKLKDAIQILGRW